MKMAILYLTCANTGEADKISDVLLEKKLIVCAKKVPVSSKFFWKDKIENEEEIVLLLETKEELFDEIEREVRRLHSHKTFVLLSIPINRAAKGVEDWMREGLK